MSIEKFNMYVEFLDGDEKEEAIYRFEERAGIAEESGATKEQAEAIAWAEIEAPK